VVTGFIGLCALYAVLLGLDVAELLLAVLEQDLAGLLEALVGELLEGDLGRLLEGRAAQDSAATAGAHGLDMVTAHEAALLLLVLDHLGVEGSPVLHVLGHGSRGLLRRVGGRLGRRRGGGICGSGRGSRGGGVVGGRRRREQAAGRGAEGRDVDGDGPHAAQTRAQLAQRGRDGRHGEQWAMDGVAGRADGADSGRDWGSKKCCARAPTATLACWFLRSADKSDGAGLSSPCLASPLPPPQHPLARQWLCPGFPYRRRCGAPRCS
jgi:hypothetical protein